METRVLNGTQVYFYFATTVAGVGSCGGLKKSLLTSSTVPPVIFSVWSFEISESNSRNQNFMISKEMHFSKHVLIVCSGSLWFHAVICIGSLMRLEKPKPQYNPTDSEFLRRPCSFYCQ